VLVGAAACLLVEGVFSSAVVDAWHQGWSSLRRPLPAPGQPLGDPVTA
jgi:hypothetical protein